MDFLFGRKKTPAEMLRQNQRALNKAMRELDRERSRLEMQEKKIIADIKKMAKMNQIVNTLKFLILYFQYLQTIRRFQSLRDTFQNSKLVRSNKCCIKLLGMIRQRERVVFIL